MTKIIKTSLLCFAIFVIATVNSNASGNNDDIEVYINFEKITFGDQEPFIDDNRVQIPLRFVSEELGADVSWNGNNNTIKIEKDQKIIVLEIGSKNYELNGLSNDDYRLDTAPKILNSGRTVVQLRFISEMYDKEVDWQEEYKKVFIFDPEKIKAPDEVVNLYWDEYVIEGSREKADELIKEGRAEELEYMIIGSEDIDDLDESNDEILEKYSLKVLSYDVKNDTALVDIELTKPDFEEVMDNYLEKALPEIEEMFENEVEGEKINEKSNEFMKQFIKEADTITHEGKVELHMVDDSWKIYDLILDEMKERWEELEKKLIG